MQTLHFGILKTQSDARLAELCARGHERAFDVLAARHRAALERCCRRLAPDGQAEDAVQQALLQAWTALRAGAEVEQVRPWLYAIARNQALTALRSRRPAEQLDEAVPAAGGETHFEARATLRAAFGALAGMRSHQREALIRTALGGESQDVIARDLGMTGGAVRQLVHRARLDLRAAATALLPMPFVEWITAAGAGGVATGALRGGAAVVAVGAALGAPAPAHPAPQPARAIVAHTPVARQGSVPHRASRVATAAAKPRRAGPAPIHPRAKSGTVPDFAPVAPRRRVRGSAPAPKPVAAPQPVAAAEPEDEPVVVQAAAPVAPAPAVVREAPPEPEPAPAPAPVAEEDHSGPGGGGGVQQDRVEEDRSGPGDGAEAGDDHRGHGGGSED